MATNRDANEIAQVRLDTESAALDLAGQVLPPTIGGLPDGYIYGVTRYADVILRNAFPERLDDLVDALGRFAPTHHELRAAGGGRTVFAKRFDQSLARHTQHGQLVWGKRNITIEKGIGFDGQTSPVSKVRGHEIDMFGVGNRDEPFPGIAVEMEWNNKDPFYDRDLINFQALHQEGAIVVGVIVTRGPDLQALLGPVIRSKDGGFKYGPSSTHWNKLVPRVNLDGGGECPLLLVGIQPDRIAGIELARQVKEKLDLARDWRGLGFPSHAEARPQMQRLREEALALLPPVRDTEPAAS